MSYVEVTTVEISPEGHHASLTGCIANELVRIEVLRKEKEVLLRKLKKLDEVIEESSRDIRQYIYTQRKLEDEYNITTHQNTPGVVSTPLHWSLTGHGGENQARRFDLYQRLSAYDAA